MNFVATTVDGAYLVEPDLIRDERGFFGRMYDEVEFTRRGLPTRFPQWSVSFNVSRGTLRGMHYQAAPHAEAKLVRCTMGVIYDVILDLRPESRTFRKWAAVELRAESPRMLYVPEGVAHGFQTLIDGSEVTYHISAAYHAELQRGVRWDDPAFGIAWPENPKMMSERDRKYPDFAV